MQRRLGHGRANVSEGRATANKDRWGLLPKVEWKDLLEKGLRPGDRAFLSSWTSGGKWTELKTAMNRDLQEVQVKGLADPSTARWVLERDRFHEQVFKGGGGFSSSGKPLPVSTREATSGGVTYQEVLAGRTGVGCVQYHTQIVAIGKGAQAIQRTKGVLPGRFPVNGLVLTANLRAVPARRGCQVSMRFRKASPFPSSRVSEGGVWVTTIPAPVSSANWTVGPIPTLRSHQPGRGTTVGCTDRILTSS